MVENNNNTYGIKSPETPGSYGYAAKGGIDANNLNKQNHSNLLKTTTGSKGGKKSRKRIRSTKYSSRNYTNNRNNRKSKKGQRIKTKNGGGGGGGGVVAPQINNSSTGAASQPDIDKLTKIQVGASINSSLDKHITGGCGSCIKTGGGINWGCKSGGRKRRKTMKNKKNRTKK
jgi:hypothetical protein